MIAEGNQLVFKKYPIRCVFFLTSISEIESLQYRIYSYYQHLQAIIQKPVENMHDQI